MGTQKNYSPCKCAKDDYLVVACSGAADVGYISDQVSRRLSLNNIRKMSCLTLIASCDSEEIEKFKKKNILVIDGCSEDCGKKIMENRGIADYPYLRITDIGFEKGKTPTSHETIKAVYNKAEVFT